jgi:hypothetical protein
MERAMFTPSSYRRIFRFCLPLFLTLPFVLLRANDEPAPPPPREGQYASDVDEIKAILDYHHHVARLDGRDFGLPEHDFDDATNITLQQRRHFRSLYPGGPETGAYQYPRWAYDFLWRLAGGGPEFPRAYTAGMIESNAFQRSLPQTGLLAVVVTANVNITNDTQAETEGYLAIDPTNPQYLVGNVNNNGSALGTSAQLMSRSADWGATWSKNTLPLVCATQADPGVAYDSAGNVYAVALEYGSGCAGKTRVNVFKSADHGATWSAAATVNATNGNDKELMAIDFQPGSACRDRLYVAWDDGGAEKVATAAAYTGPWTVYGTTLDTLSIGTDIAVGPTGEVYDVWADYNLNQINFSKSTNCGAAWSAKQTIATTFDNYDYGIPAMCSRRALVYPAVDVDRSTGPRRGCVYAVWNDFTADQPSGCVAASANDTANIYFSASCNGGTTWNAKKLVHQDIPRTDQFSQWMRVDDADGCIHVSWHDTRNDPNRVKTDIYYTKSCDGGATFDPETLVTTAMTDESSAGANVNQYGDYEGFAVRNGVAYPYWTDRRTASGTDEEQFTAKICSDPKTVGATGAADLNACAATGVNLSWSPPTVYWGDGGSGTRKFQLFKDGVLAQDNIAQATTLLVFSPGDAASHSYVIKAVNSCGNVAAYAAASATDGVDAAAPANLGGTLLGGKSGANLSLSWTASPAPDLNHYNIHGAVSPATYPAGWSLLGSSATPNATDPLVSGNRFYLVSAVDNCGNESVVE